MFRGYILLLCSVICAHGFILGDTYCNYLYANNCFVELTEELAKNSSLANMRHCEEEDVPTYVDYLVPLKENDNSMFPGLLTISFKLPKNTCKLGFSLLATTAAKTQEECEAYPFDKDIEMKTHTGENTVCFIQNGNSALLTKANVTEVLCQEKISIRYQYAFTACYAVRFHFGEDKYTVRERQFIQTNYIRSEVQVPSIRCTYEVPPVIDHSLERIHATTVLLMSMDTAPRLEIGFVPDLNEKEACYSPSYAQLQKTIIDLERLNGQNCTVNVERGFNGKSTRITECNFTLKAVTKDVNYCVVIRLLDERCRTETLWHPPGREKIPCGWIKPCLKVQGNTFKQMATTHSNLFLSIIVVISTMFTMCCVIYTAHRLRMRRNMVQRYSWGTDPDSANTRNEKIPNLDEKVYEYKDGERRDIVLLYPKGSPAFMALMADFRGILSKICHCSVHDWHEGVVWNHVARMGASDWFRETLRNDCNVIWIDTPTTRSLLSSQFHKTNEGANCEWKKCTEIGDFRDAVFPVVLNIAKKNVQESESGRSRHFIVKFKGFDGFKDHGDPFVDLSPDGFYSMPEDLSQLCSHLLTLSTNNPGQDTRTEEDFIQRHLTRGNDESRQ